MYHYMVGKFFGKDQLRGHCKEMTLIVCLFILFLNNRAFLNLLQQQNVAIVDGLVASVKISRNLWHFNIYELEKFHAQLC